MSNKTLFLGFLIGTAFLLCVMKIAPTVLR